MSNPRRADVVTAFVTRGRAVLLLRRSDLVRTYAGRWAWRVHPFRFALREGAIVRLDWEHAENNWISPDALDTLPTVPGLARAWRAVSREDGR